MGARNEDPSRKSVTGEIASPSSVRLSKLPWKVPKRPRSTCETHLLPDLLEPQLLTDRVGRGVGHRGERVHYVPAPRGAGAVEHGPNGRGPDPSSLVLREHHPSDLLDGLLALLVAPDPDRPRRRARIVVGDDHEHPVLVCLGGRHVSRILSAIPPSTAAGRGAPSSRGRSGLRRSRGRRHRGCGAPLSTRPSETLGQLPVGDEPPAVRLIVGAGSRLWEGRQCRVTLEDHGDWWRRVLVRSASARRARPGWHQGGVTHRRRVIPCLSRMRSKSDGY